MDQIRMLSARIQDLAAVLEEQQAEMYDEMRRSQKLCDELKRSRERPRAVPWARRGAPQAEAGRRAAE